MLDSYIRVRSRDTNTMTSSTCTLATYISPTPSGNHSLLQLSVYAHNVCAAFHMYIPLTISTQPLDCVYNQCAPPTSMYITCAPPFVYVTSSSVYPTLPLQLLLCLSPQTSRIDRPPHIHFSPVKPPTLLTLTDVNL